MKHLSRWPLLTATSLLFSAGLAVDLWAPEATSLAVGAFICGAVALGSFLYAEGARHREWNDREDAQD